MHLNMIDLEQFLYVKEDPQLNDPNFLNIRLNLTEDQITNCLLT